MSELLRPALKFRTKYGKHGWLPAVIATTMDYPYELHIVTFPTKIDFQACRDDPQRTQYIPLKEESISRILLIEGELL